MAWTSKTSKVMKGLLYLHLARVDGIHCSSHHAVNGRVDQFLPDAVVMAKRSGLAAFEFHTR